MKKLNIVAFAMIFSICMVSSAFAGDWAEMRFFGFSDDGAYMAFEEYGEYDDHISGDYATTYFIDVDKNIYATPPIVYEYSDNDEKTTGEFSQAAREKKYKSSVEAALKRFKIERGNTGKLVAAHMLSDHSFERPTRKMGQFMNNDGQWIEKMVPAYEGVPLVKSYNRNKIIFSPRYFPVNPNPEDFFELELKEFSSKQPCEARGVKFATNIL